MFNWAVVIPFSVILGLCGWGWYQSQRIDGLRAENRIQAQTIEQQREVNRVLKLSLAEERQAVETAQKNAKALQQKVETVQREIKTILANAPCANSPLPDGVSEHIKRLHRQGGERQD